MNREFRCQQCSGSPISQSITVSHGITQSVKKNAQGGSILLPDQKYIVECTYYFCDDACRRNFTLDLFELRFGSEFDYEFLE